jgi:hypothetical protein
VYDRYYVKPVEIYQVQVKRLTLVERVEVETFYK